MPWEVDSYQINVDAGDGAIHVLVKVGLDGVRTPDKFVLMDGGFGGYGDCFLRYMLEHLKQVYALPQPIKFNAIVSTHWDADHIGGIVGLFEHDIKKQWAEELSPQEERDFNRVKLADKWKLFIQAYFPSFLANDADVYCPFWKSSRTQTLLSTTETVSIHPSIWEKTETGGKVKIQKANPWAKGGKTGKDYWVYSNPFAVLHDTADALLGFNFFTGKMACGNGIPHTEITNPKFVSASLADPEGRPALFCILADVTICGGYTYTGLKKWQWTGAPDSLRLACNGSGKDPDPVAQYLGDIRPESVKASDRPSVGVIPDADTTNVNQSSIACMIIWPDRTKASVSHYLGGDLGEEIEQMVLKWSTVPDAVNAGIRVPTKCKAMKLSHHGAKQSTPFEMLYAFDPSFIVVSNGVRTDWNHPKLEILLTLEALKKWKMKRSLDVVDDGMNMDIEFDFRALNYPPYLSFDTNDENLAVDPGSVESLWDKEFQKALLKLHPDNDSFIREVAKYDAKSVTDNYKLKKAVVVHLMKSWNYISSFAAHKYAASIVSWGTFFDVSANQELRAVLISQTSEGPKGLENITSATSGRLDKKDTPKPIKGVRRIARGKRDYGDLRRSTRQKTEFKFFEPEVRGVFKKAIGKNRYTKIRDDGNGENDSGDGEDEADDNVRPTKAIISSDEALVINPQPPVYAGISPESLLPPDIKPLVQGHRYFFLAPGAFEDPPKDQAMEVADMGFANVLGWLRFPALILAAKPVTPAPDQTADCSVDPSDELADWIGIMFNAKGTSNLVAKASAATVTGLSFQTDLAATMTSKARKALPPSNLLFNVLTFNTNMSSFALGTNMFQGPQMGDGEVAAPLTVGNMLVFGLEPINDPWDLSLADLCTFLECDIKTLILSGLAHERFAFDMTTSVPSRNAVWFLPDALFTTVLRLQFVHRESPQTQASWIHGLFSKFAEFAKVTVTEPVRLIVRKTWKSETAAEDAYAVSSEWQLTIKCSVRIENRMGQKLNFLSAVTFNRSRTQLLLVLTGSNIPGSQTNASDIGDICDFLTGLLPLDTPVPSIKSYIPAASDIYLRRILLTLSNGGGVHVELVFEIRLSSTSFLVTLIIGPEPQFTGSLFGTLSPKDAADASLHPFYEEHLQMLPITKIDMSQPLDLGDFYKSMANSTLETKPPFGLQLVTASFTVNQSVIALQGLITDLSDPDPSPSVSTLPRIDLDLATLSFEYHFADKSVRMGAGFNFSLTPRKTSRDPKPLKMGIMIEYDAGDWVLQGSVANLSFAHLYQFFDTDNNDEVMNILERVCIRFFELAYRYKSGGKANSIDITGVLGLGNLDLGFAYHSEGAGDWDLYASLQSGPNNPNESLLGIISEFCGDSVRTQLPKCLLDIPLKGDQAAIELSLGQHDGYFVLVSEINVASGVTIMFLHLAKKQDRSAGAKKVAPKRVLLLSVAPIAVTASKKPFISALVQPFDKLDFVWVQDDEGGGLVQSEVDVLNARLGGKHQIRYKKTAKKPESALSQSDEVLLKAGCHFLVVSDGSVILDYAFKGNKEKKPKGDDNAELADPKDDVQPGDTAPLKKQLGAISVSGIGFSFSNNTISITLTATCQLGTFNVDLVGLTVHVGMDKGGNLLNLNDAHIDVSLSGIGLGLNKPPLRIAGMLVDKSIPPTKDQPGLDDYFGGAEVGFKAYSLLGLGRYSKSGSGLVSFFAYVQLNGPLAQLGPVQINGVKAGVGYNTAIKKPDLSNIPSFPFCALSQSSSGLVTAKNKAMSSDLISVQSDKDPLVFLESFISGGWFTPSDGTTWVAMGMEVIICETVDISAAVVVTITPKVLLDIYAQGALQMPSPTTEKDPYLNVQFVFQCTVDFGAGSMVMQSSLASTSYIFHPSCHLTGGFAMASWWDPSPVAGDWVFTVGGYHPLFKVPSHYPVPDRIGISWQVNSLVSITGSAYFALTPNVVMAGVSLIVQFNASIISATLTAWADFLINFAPFYFITDVGVCVDLSITIGWGWLSFTIRAHIGAVLHLEGPPVHGIAEIDILSHVFIVAIGSGSDGRGVAQEPLRFDELCHLLLKQSKGLQDRTYHVLNLQSGGMLAEPGSTESSATTPWRVRAATFSFQVQALVPISWAAVNAEKPDNSIEADPRRGPIVSTAPIYSTPMQLRGKQKFDSWLSVKISTSDGIPARVKFLIEPLYSKLASNLWGEYSTDTDPLRSGNSISKLLNPADSGTGLDMLTGVLVSADEPTPSSDTLGPFNLKLISDHSLFDDKTQPILPSQPWQKYGLPQKRQPGAASPSLNPPPLKVRWGLGHSPSGSCFDDHDDDGLDHDDDEWEEVKLMWTDRKLGRVRRGVADATAELFGWDQDVFSALDETPMLLAEQLDDIYLRAPFISVLADESK